MLDGVGYTVVYSVMYTHSTGSLLDVLTTVPVDVLMDEATSVLVTSAPWSLK
jgi:hypothetical protein